MPRDHRTYEVFGLADSLAVEVYRVTADLPLEERFGMQAQIRRAAVSSACNIVEGCTRSSDRAFSHFLDIAAGSAAETRYLLNLAQRLGLLEARRVSALDDQADHLLRALNRLRQTIGAGDGDER